MEKNDSIKFANLLKKRKQLAKSNKKNTKNISLKDPQLMDVLKNFNESKEYEIFRRIVMENQ